MSFAHRHRPGRSPRWFLVLMTTGLVASACGGSDVSGTGRAAATGGGTGTGGSGGTNGGGTAGIVSSGGNAGRGGLQGSGGTGTGGLGAGGFIACPPCAAPPGPNCVGSGPCGCGPYTCTDAGAPSGPCGGSQCGIGTSCCGPPECGRCVPSTSGVFCPDYCDYCGGAYQRHGENPALCSRTGDVVWEVNGTSDLTPFAVPACQDAGTNIPRFCCAADFRPVCP